MASLDNFRERRLVVVDQNAPVPHADAVAERAQCLSNAQDEASQVGLLQHESVRGLQQVGVHGDELALAPQSGHSADVGDGLDGQLRRRR